MGEQDQDESTATLPLEPAAAPAVTTYDNPDTVELPVFRLMLHDDDEQNGFGIDGEGTHSLTLLGRSRGSTNPVLLIEFCRAARDGVQDACKD